MFAHDITLSLRYSANIPEWRIYANNGHYWTVKNLDELGEAVRKFLLSDARETAAMLTKSGDEI